MKSSGNSVIAYVYTLYGQRPNGDIFRDVDKYFVDFGEALIDGFFLDETMSIWQPEFIQKYKEISDYIKTEFEIPGLNCLNRPITI